MIRVGDGGKKLTEKTLTSPARWVWQWYAVCKVLRGKKYDKLHACAKHYAVHSGPEWNRHSFNAENIDPRDLWETYLPAFKDLVQKAHVKEVMCAYNRFEGEPCCGSNAY